MIFGSSFSCLIQVFEFREECIRASFACEEPLEGREGRIHTTCGIDAWSDLEADDISIILPELLSSFEKCSKSMRARLVHLGETEGHDGSILAYDGHTVRDGSEGRKVDVLSQYVIDSSSQFTVHSSQFCIFVILAKRGSLRYGFSSRE